MGDSKSEGTICKIYQPPIILSEVCLYPCQYCDKLFSQKLLSKRHMRKCSRRSNITERNNINNNIQIKEETDTFIEMNDRVQSNTDVSMMLQDLNNRRSTTENMDPENTNNKKSKTPKDGSARIEKYTINSDVPNTSFVTISSLESNPNNELLKRCRYCSACFRDPLELLRHKRTHNSDKIILPIEEIEKYLEYPNRSYCPICKQKLRTNNFKSVFTKHLLTHSPSILYKCVICKKEFTRKDHMTAHKKRHIVSLEG